jgi:hypothetical protein
VSGRRNGRSILSQKALWRDTLFLGGAQGCAPRTKKSSPEAVSKDPWRLAPPINILNGRHFKMASIHYFISPPQAAKVF